MYESMWEGTLTQGQIRDKLPKEDVFKLTPEEC